MGQTLFDRVLLRLYAALICPYLRSCALNIAKIVVHDSVIQMTKQFIVNVLPEYMKKRSVYVFGIAESITHDNGIYFRLVTFF